MSTTNESAEKDDSDDILSNLEKELNSLNAATDIPSPTPLGRPYRSLPRNYMPPNLDDLEPPPDYAREHRRFTFDHSPSAHPPHYHDTHRHDFDDEEVRTYPYQRRKYDGPPAYPSSPGPLGGHSHGGRPCSSCHYRDDSFSVVPHVPHSPLGGYAPFYPWRPIYKVYRVACSNPVPPAARNACLFVVGCRER